MFLMMNEYILCDCKNSEKSLDNVHVNGYFYAFRVIFLINNVWIEKNALPLQPQIQGTWTIPLYIVNSKSSKTKINR